MYFASFLYHFDDGDYESNEAQNDGEIDERKSLGTMEKGERHVGEIQGSEDPSKIFATVEGTTIAAQVTNTSDYESWKGYSEEEKRKLVGYKNVHSINHEHTNNFGNAITLPNKGKHARQPKFHLRRSKHRKNINYHKVSHHVPFSATYH